MIKGLDDLLEEQTDQGHVIGTWGFDSHLDFTKMNPEQNNLWFFEQGFNFLRAFFGLVLPDNMELVTYNATQRIQKKNLDQQTFLDVLMLALKRLKEPLWTFRLNLTIIGFLRTMNVPDKPIRLHIQEPATFIAWGGPDETGFQNFSISYNLFSSQLVEDSKEVQLWSMNQPLLEKGLRKWERQAGRVIEVVRSNSRDVPIHEHGFHKPTKS